MKNKPFESIDIDRQTISQDELNISNKTRSNLFAWNGQFSPQFVEALLKRFSNNNDIVFDPFLGSGTTLCESARMGLPSFGTELNASAYYMAKTYELANIDIDERMRMITDISQIINAINNEDTIVEELIKHLGSFKEDTTSNIIKTLIILLDLYNNEISFELLDKKWRLLQNIIWDIPYSSGEIHADMGDARAVKCSDDSATLLITSPPYINVFNYHQKYRRSVEALGYNVLEIARNEFGSNRKNRGNRLLTVIQYCIDMALSLKEASRVCKENSRLIYVVGRESAVLGYSFCNSRLIYEIGTEIFGFEFLLRQERVFKNRFGQNIYEDILHFKNNSSYKVLQEDEIISSARDIAIRMLNENAEKDPDNKNKDLIYEAIEKANKVKKSEV